MDSPSGHGLQAVIRHNPSTCVVNPALINSLRIAPAPALVDIIDHPHHPLSLQCLPVEAFEWFSVGKAVGNVRNEGAELIVMMGPEPV
ncbi:hypothetical protein [Pseudomonas sp. NPDC089401]|uniref:hypothetical protein n=1 Tax=Pseudomonas sp. NPDC089401 TaxID=3364462 RepID=UPI003815082A